MPLKINFINTFISWVAASVRDHGLVRQYDDAEPLIRAELFSSDQMERHGVALAALHRLGVGRGSDQLLERLGENERLLSSASELLRSATYGGARITPAGEWLLDNFYLIEEQIRTARRHLPKGYCRELPLLADGPSCRLPRVYDIAVEAIAHGDGRINPEGLNCFVAAYQKGVDLKLGELWAIPIMLRLALIENLRRVAARIAVGMIDRNQAGDWADQMLAVAQKNPQDLILVIADMARSNPPRTDSFVAELVRRLKGHGSALALPLTWMQQHLSEFALTIEQLVQSETHSQASNQVSISNSIGSLRSLGTMDWREFVESMSSVDSALREDADGIYGRMDFATRDRYRHVVEKIANHSRLTEREVACHAVRLATQPRTSTTDHERKTHVGYFLIGEGLPQLEQAAGMRRSLATYMLRLGSRHATLLYLGAIGLLTLCTTGFFLGTVWSDGLAGWQLGLIGIPALLGSSQIAVALINWLATLLARPHPLPRMDYSRGIPPASRTLVVIPTLLTSPQNADALVEALEVRFLANRDANLHFSLLTDFCDAATETLPEDDALVQQVRERIEALNLKYRHTEHDTFFLFHRPRLWNAQEHIWMGYERKRGKLGHLNALLREGNRSPFLCIVGNTAILREVKFVITLDTDTQLPREAAQAFAATMAHPLNRAHYDAAKQLVTEGYGILQPRLTVSLPSANRSRYAQLHGGDSGIDPYTRTVSDVYQDVFHEGSFIGKGIYDVDAFEQSLKDRLPENRILSHDLLEGCYARAGLLSDVQLHEDCPSRYSADAGRRYRWIRGDWQIAAWLLRNVPLPDRTSRTNPLPMRSQWKLFDNLRRSLAPAGLILLFLWGWIIMPSFVCWTLSVLGIILLPPLAVSALALLRKPQDARLGEHVFVTLKSSARQFMQSALALACLPYEAYFSLHAIGCTAVRMLFTHRRMLEWKSSSEVQLEFDTRCNGRADPYGLTDLLRHWQVMWIAPLMATSVMFYLALAKSSVLLLAAPILALWFCAPTIAWWISRPTPPKSIDLQPKQIDFLRALARKTWAFFETFVTAKDHWLPPDNYQEHPVECLAHRTSPTNMGLGLLANMAAYDFGYIHAGTLIERTANALQAMQGLDRYKGHFYNWYDTLNLRPLPPHYVSTVDSGNLAGHLLTLRPGLLALADQSILNRKIFQGIGDTFAVLSDAAAAKATQQGVLLHEAIKAADASPPATMADSRLCLEQLVRLADLFVVQLNASPASGPGSEANRWAHALLRQCQDALDELNYFVPWTNPPAAGVGTYDLAGFGTNPTLRELAMLDHYLVIQCREQNNAMTIPPALRAQVTVVSARASERIAQIESLAQQLIELAGVDYTFLYDATKHLLSVGYNVDEHRLDPGHYDLLASEARLCSFLAIAQGDAPQESWFALGRLLSSSDGDSILLSWSGSMFEYLMPMLVMPTYANTLLEQTCSAAVKRQISYGQQRGVPWGISESGYNAVDASLNYQYRAFGVPGLGLKRGLADDLVIAPYASALALMVMPDAACHNLQRLAAGGLLGRYGMYEAIDYTPSRLPRGQSSAVVRSFMAHHQGMTLLSLAYLLLDQPMQKRFLSDPLFQATTLLLQERIPAATAAHFHTPDLSSIRTESAGPELPMRVLNHAGTKAPEVQLLSNGRYHVMVTNAGGGYSRWKDYAVTRWREDATCDNWGTFCYLRDVTSQAFWSTAHQPTLKQAETYEAIFSESRAEFRRRDHDYETHTEIVVSPEDDIELRRVRITNRARMRRTIEITSYAEVVMAPPASDALHPAFSNLFVQTEIIHDQQALLCTRRPRSVAEPMVWMFHLMAVHDAEAGAASYETDRMRFIGRARTAAAPAAMTKNALLSNTYGSVLDPIVAIRYSITLDANQTATIDVVSGVSETRDTALALVGKYRDRHLADRVLDLARTHSWVNLQQINASESDAQLYARLAGSIIYANPAMRAEAVVLAGNRRGQPGLWGYAISGDLPIVLLQISDQANIELVRQLVRAHAYWRLKGLAVDLVIWNEDHAGYRQLLQEQIMGLIAADANAHLADRSGGIFVRVAEQISNEDRILFQTVARAIISDTRGTLAEQINRLGTQALPSVALVRKPADNPVRAVLPPIQQPPADLQFFNGSGGFSADGREYVIVTTPERTTPVPWVNVIANAGFGTVISESGAAYTWSENAHEFRYTPWHGDPVTDASGEAFYIRDEKSGHFWSPTVLPCRGSAPYITRHGFGYSVFEHDEQDIRTTLTVFIDESAPVKYSLLRIRNHSGRTRQLTATGYVEWVLGSLRTNSAMYVITGVDAVSGALTARNPYSTEFANRMAFFDAGEATRLPNVTFSGDRTEFLGRNGNITNPAAMTRAKLSNRVGAAMDPCAAIQVPFELADGQEREIVFRLGAAGPSGAAAVDPLRHKRSTQAAQKALEAVQKVWTDRLGSVQVETPDRSLNILANGWLPYQIISCRLWARSGYYQSGGAFGFRDQLQDTMALAHHTPALLREHVLRCAAHQYPEGDAQHWWHPPAGRGVRTHCSDDFLWLPQAVCRYVTTTGDTGVLIETIPFVEGRPVNPEDDSYYDLPVRSNTTATLYQHCVLAIQRGLRFGAHGLPLMGSGDWNDGMNLVGMQGKGESVWLGFFLYDTLMRFIAIARAQGDHGFAERCHAEADQLRANLEQHGWDGAWYRRAYFDDGSPLGSALNVECQIDSIAQSWSVLSGAAGATRTHAAMASLDQRLVRRDHALIRLLDPPFDKSALNPGYIKGYVPGVRENGGQYTHGAIWAAMAFAALDDRERAWELFNMINPVNHANSPEAIATYKVEPYVVAADVYAVAPHTGRGGWTWYTGSAGWMYRLILESLLGFTLSANKLHFNPCLPADWNSFKLQYRYRTTLYHITVKQLIFMATATNVAAGTSVIVDGVSQKEGVVSLIDDHLEHSVEIAIQRARD